MPSADSVDQSLFLEPRQPVSSFKLIKLTVRVTGADELDL
jgi:hypothetical protein